MAATISIPSGFPDATTSGVPAGTVLTAYTGPRTITTAGTVIEGKIIDAGLVINAANVTIKNCVITGGYYFGVDGEKGGSALLIQNCDIIGPGTNGEGNSGILGTGTFIGNDISAYENGISTTGGSGGVISGNYIHDITSSKPDAHYTGIQVEGGETNLRIENNTVMNDRDSNIFLQALWGPISNVVINNNYVGGSAPGNNSYNIYVESRFGYPVTDVTITNNYINKGYYGYFSIVNSSPTMSGNVLFDSDHGIFPPTGGSPTPPTNPAPPTAPVIASFSIDTGSVGDRVTNDSTLTLTGTAAANSTVKIFDGTGTTPVGTATANSSGQWILTTQALSDGTHNLAATSTNSTGQTSAASAALAVTVDTVVPAAPVAVSDSVVNANHVLVSGTAAANSTITVYDGDTMVGTGTTNSSGNWSVTTSALSNGAHAMTAKATDVAGNVSIASQVFDAVIGATPTPPTSPTTPKIVSFSQDSGTVGDQITNDNTLTLSGTAVANSTVKVFDGSTQVGTATANLSGAWTLTTTALVDGSHALTATATTTSSSATSPALFEDFNPWSGTVSPDGIWRIAGTWTGTGGDILQPGNVKFTDTYAGETNTGFMYLTTPAGSPLRGAELQSMTTPGYSYGYYEVRMQTANVPDGGVASFFWIEQPNYGSHEWDVEFTLSDSWAGTTNPGRVAFHTHPLDNGQWVNLDFNPSQAFHEYGFLWTPGRIDFTVDGEVVRTVTDPALKTDATGYIMMNTWSSGNPNFGGGPPAQDATSVYDWVKFYPNATSIPAEEVGGTTGGTTSTSNPLSVTVDTKVPTAPVVSSNAIVNTNQVKLSGTAEANSKVTVYDKTAVVGTGTTSSTGDWSITTNALSSGTHALTTTAADVAGNVSVASQAINSVISTTAPPSEPPSTTTTIESFGSTKLVLVGDNYRLDGASGSGPSLKYGGADFVDGHDGTWAPIGAEKTATGYQVAWKEASTGLYTAWNTDNNGNYVSHVSALTGSVSGGSVSGTNSALKSFETSLQQDLNGDGQIGASTAGAPLSSVALTTMSKNWSDIVTIKGVADANSQIKLYDGNTPLGTVTTAADGTWSFKTSSAVSDTVHTYTAKQIDSTGQVVGTSGNAILGSTASNTLNGTSGDDIFIGGRQSDTFVFAANFGRDVIRDFKASGTAQDTIQFSNTVFDSFASVLSHASQDGQDVAISTGNDTLTLKNTKLGALNSNDFHFA